MPTGDQPDRARCSRRQGAHIAQTRDDCESVLLGKPHFTAYHPRLLITKVFPGCACNMQVFSQPLVACHQLAWRHHWLVWAPRASIPSAIPVDQKSRRRPSYTNQVTSLTAPVARQCFMYAHPSIKYVPDKRSRRIGNFAHARRIGLQCARPHQIKTPKTLIAIVVSPDRADSM
jgi:hypothetical protein